MTEDNKCYFSMTPEEVADNYGLLGIAGFLQSYSDPRAAGYRPPTKEEEAAAATERLRKFNLGMTHLGKITIEEIKMTEAFERWWNEKYAGSWKPQVLEDYSKEIARSAWDEAWDEALERTKSRHRQENNFLNLAKQQQQEADLKREQQLTNIFQRVFDVKPSSVRQFIKSTTEEELLEAESWCVKAYHFKGRNNVKLPPRPSCLNKLDDAEVRDNE